MLRLNTSTSLVLLYVYPPFTLQPREAIVKNTKNESGIPYFNGSAVVYVQSTDTNSSRAVLVGVGDAPFS